MTPQGQFEILIAEDNSGDMMLVREALQTLDVSCNLRAASDGATAIALIEELDRNSVPRLDLLILDMHLPKFDGVAILERLRQTMHLKATPVIALSGLSADRIHSQTGKFGLVYPFHKPADFRAFMILGGLASRILRSGMAASASEAVSQTRGKTA